MTKREQKINVAMQFSDGEENLLGTLSTIEGKTYFKYHSDFIQKKINPSPFKMKFDESIQACPSMPFDGLFGLFADSLPDGWGKLILDRYLISKGEKPDQYTHLQQLSLIGKNGTGALIYQPNTPILDNNDFNIDLTAYAEQSLQILSGKNEEITDEFYRLTGTSGGARPKIQVLYNPITKVLKSINDNRNKDDEFWIIKFPSTHDLPDIANIEYAYYLMAKDAGIEMAPSKLFKGKKNHHFFGTKRFDRTEEGNLHLHSAAGLLHDNYRWVLKIDFFQKANRASEMQGVFFWNSLSYCNKNTTQQMACYICSQRVFIVFHIRLQIYLHYPDSAAQIFIVYKKL